MLVEMQRPKGICHRCGIKAGKAQRVEIDVDRRIFADSCHITAYQRVLFVVAQVLSHFALDVVGILQHGLKRAVLRDEVCRLLGAYAGHAGDVVRGIAFESEKIRNLIRTHAVVLFYSSWVHDGDIAHALLGGHYARELRRKLIGVFISCDEIDAIALGLAHGGDCTQDVVSLKALHAHAGDPHRLEQTAHQRELHRKRLVHGRALRLVALQKLHAPIRAMNIPCADDDIRLEVCEHLEQHAHEPKACVSRGAVYRHIGVDGMICAMDKRVAVYHGNGAAWGVFA